LRHSEDLILGKFIVKRIQKYGNRLAASGPAFDRLPRFLVIKAVLDQGVAVKDDR